MATKLPPETYLSIWQAAKAEEIGLRLQVHTDDTALVVNALYDCRKTFGGFDDMIICQPNPPGTIYVMHETTRVD